MSYEVLEHTADVGLRATAPTLEELFAEASRGMAELAGAWTGPGEGETVRLTVAGGDLEGLLVDWLGEILYVHDSRNTAIRSVALEAVSTEGATGRVTVSPLAPDAEDEGTQIKAITFHQLEVRRKPEGWTARVFFDI